MEKKHIPYKVPSKVIDWKANWFYVVNHEPTLPDGIPRPPKIRNECTRDAENEEQVTELLNKIALLRDSGITGRLVVLSWIGRRYQPLQKRFNFGFEYRGLKDPSQFSAEKIHQ